MNENRLTISMFIAGIVITTVSLTVGVIFYYLFFEKSWLRYENVPFPALQTYTRPGSPIPIHVARCNDDSVPHVYTVARSLERVTKPNEPRDYVMLPDLSVQIMPGCSEGDTIAHVVPLKTQSGIWRIVGMSEVRGTLRSHLVEWYSVPFEVSDK